MKLLLNGFEDDGQGQAEATVGNTGSAGFAAFEGAGGVAEGGFHLFQVGWVALEEAEIDDMAEAHCEEVNKLPLAGGVVDVREAEVGVRALVNDPIDKEGEVGEGGEVFHNGCFVVGRRVRSCQMARLRPGSSDMSI